MTTPNDNARHSAFYASPISQFLAADDATVLGRLAGGSGFAIDGAQTEAWKEQVLVLKQTLPGVDGSLFLEFKVGEHRYAKGAYNQVWEYALDLKNFHEASRELPIFPVLCATNGTTPDAGWQRPHADGVYPPIKSNAATVGDAVRSAIALAPSAPVNADAWGRAPYRPSPIIIEAANCTRNTRCKQLPGRMLALAISM